MKNETDIYPVLITVTKQYGEVYLDVHRNVTEKQAIDNVKNENNTVFAVTPTSGLELAKGLIDIAFDSKIKRKNKNQVETPYDKTS
jgi:hypothetical protein